MNGRALAKLPGRARRAWDILRDGGGSGSDRRLALRMMTWALFLPVLKRVLPLRSLVRLLWAGPGPARRRPAREHAIAALGFRIFGPGSRREGRCLERSLLLYRFLSAAGAMPELVTGIARDAEGLFGHAWVVVDGSPVQESAEALEGFTTVAVFGAGGTLLAGSVSPGAALPAPLPAEGEYRCRAG